MLNGRLSVTLAPLTLAATGKVYVKGATNVTLDALTVLATGTSSVTATLSVTLADLTLFATGGLVTDLMLLEDTFGHWLFEDGSRIAWG